MVNKLEGKVAIVSGSGRGIGREIALKLAGEGARVVINDLDPEPAKQTVAEIVAAGGQAVACIGSVTETGFADRFVGAALESYGGLDIIVNNAGYTWDNVVQKMTDEQWEAMLAVHLTAPFRILRAASHCIREATRKEAAEGRDVFRKVVNISSTSGVYGNAGQANYAAAKAGINGLTKAMAKEWGRYKVNVNSVAFGLIRTRLTEADADAGASIDIEGQKIRVGVNPQILKNAEAMIPLGRGGTPQEAAGAVYLFCIPESNYVSGQVLVCGGGRP
jgi:3-oxoacyl-[acyl-carrier protein] reductase